MIESDSHTHSSFSTDSEADVRKMIEGAMQKGLKEICLTDHYDKDYPTEPGEETPAFVFGPEEYFRVLEECRREYADRITVKIGVETGLQPHLGGFYRELAGRYPFDFVIGSVHLIGGADPYDGAVFQGRSDGQVYSQMFKETLDNLERTDSFDVLGHIDYVVRYGKRKAEEYSYAALSDEIDAVLKKVLDMGKGIELNTSGFRYGLGFCHPHPDILRRYRALGGEIITVGSDAHCPQYIAYGFDRAKDILSDCGFRYYTVFEQRKPLFRKL